MITMGNVDTSDCITEAERNQILNSQKAPYISRLGFAVWGWVVGGVWVGGGVGRELYCHCIHLLQRSRSCCLPSDFVQTVIAEA